MTVLNLCILKFYESAPSLQHFGSRKSLLSRKSNLVTVCSLWTRAVVQSQVEEKQSCVCARVCCFTLDEK